MSLKEISQGRSDIHKIDPRHINVQKDWNGRDFNDASNLEHVDTLAKSIAEIGIKEPLTVFTNKADGKVYLVDGECRLRAAIRAIEVYKADIKTVPVKSDDQFSNDADRLFSQIIRNSGKNFTPLESAKVYKRLLDMGWNQTDIAKKAGISPGRVSQVLEFLTMPEAVKTMVTKGEVSASLAVKIVAENPEKATRVLKEASMAAQSDGRKRVLPKDIQEVAPKAARGYNKNAAPTVAVDAATILHDAFDLSEVDQESEEHYVTIKMPAPEFEKVRKAFKL